MRKGSVALLTIRYMIFLRVRWFFLNVFIIIIYNLYDVYTRKCFSDIDENLEILHIWK